MKWNKSLFLRNVEFLIEKHCASKKDFNEKIGQRDAFSRWKSFNPSMRSLEKICYKFDVSLEWLLTGEIPEEKPEAWCFSNKVKELYPFIPKYVQEINEAGERELPVDVLYERFILITRADQLLIEQEAKKYSRRADTFKKLNKKMKLPKKPPTENN